MINSSIYNLCAGYADGFVAATGKAVVPAGRSMLSTLVSLSTVGAVPEGGPVSYAEVLQAQTQDTMDGPSLHTAAIGAQIDGLIPLVSSHISFVQNTVRPKVIGFDEALREAVERQNERSPYEMFNIVQVAEPELLHSEDFMALINRFADDQVTVPPSFSQLPAQSLEQLVNVMSVSSGSLNEQIQNWIASMGENWLQDLWAEYFATGNAEISGQNIGQFVGGIFGMDRLPPFQRMNNALAVFLLSRGLLDDPIDGYSMSLDSWRDLMDKVSRFSAAQFRNSERFVEQTVRGEVVVLGVSSDQRRISVYAPMYMKYLEEGGTVEDVLGAALSNENINYSLDVFQTRTQDFQAIWKTFQVTNQSAMDYKALTTLRATAKSLFENVLTEVDSDEMACIQQLGNSFQAMRTEADLIISGMDLNAIKRTEELALCLIAGVRFAHTPAKMFLAAMVEAEHAGCTSPQEAAAYAAALYVCDHLSCEMAVITD